MTKIKQPLLYNYKPFQTHLVDLAAQLFNHHTRSWQVNSECEINKVNFSPNGILWERFGGRPAKSHVEKVLSLTWKCYLPPPPSNIICYPSSFLCVSCISLCLIQIPNCAVTDHLSSLKTFPASLVHVKRKLLQRLFDFFSSKPMCMNVQGVEVTERSDFYRNAAAELGIPTLFISFTCLLWPYFPFIPISL